MKEKQKKINTITRKIQLIINQENYKEVYETLYEWQEKTFRAYNFTATHLYIQQNLQEFFYFNEDFKIKLSNKEDGVLNTSKRNTTYQLLSSKFKGEMPAVIFSEISSRLGSSFALRRVEYFSGKRSLETFKRNVPIPIPSVAMKNFHYNEELKNYEFDIFNFGFKTNFGRDLSGNQTLMTRAVNKLDGYKICGSSIQLKGKKIFLLLVLQFESDKMIDSEKEAKIKLSLDHPVIITQGKKQFTIGTKEEFLYRRLAIQQARTRAQKAVRYANGGKGIKEKTKAVDRFADKEKDYVQTRLHTYSKSVIDYCRKNNIGKLILENQEEEMTNLEQQIKLINSNDELSKKEKEELIEQKKFVIANWSYYGLMEKLKYKAGQIGIIIEQEK